MAKTLTEVNTDAALGLSVEIEKMTTKFNGFLNSLNSEDRQYHLEQISSIKRNSRLLYDQAINDIEQEKQKLVESKPSTTSTSTSTAITQPEPEPKEAEKKEPNIFEKIATVAMGGVVLGTGEPASSPGMFNVVEYITGDITYKGDGRNFYVDIVGHGSSKNYHDHVACGTVEDKERAKKALRAAGIQIGSEYIGRENDRGYHSKNLAFDVPGSQWRGSGTIGPIEYQGSAKVRSILGIGGGGQSTAQPQKAKPITLTPTSTPKPQIQAQQKSQPQPQVASSSSPGMLNSSSVASSGITREQLQFATV